MTGLLAKFGLVMLVVMSGFAISFYSLFRDTQSYGMVRTRPGCSNHLRQRKHERRRGRYSSKGRAAPSIVCPCAGPAGKRLGAWRIARSIRHNSTEPYKQRSLIHVCSVRPRPDSHLPIPSFLQVWQSLFKAMLGDTEYFEALSGTSYERVATVLLVVYLIILTVMMLNLLVAVLSTAHAKVDKNADLEYKVRLPKIDTSLARRFGGGRLDAASRGLGRAFFFPFSFSSGECFVRNSEWWTSPQQVRVARAVVYLQNG